MTNDDLKKFRVVVREELKAELKVALVPIYDKLDGITDQLAEVSIDVAEIKDTLKVHNKKIKTVEKHLTSFTPAQ